MPRYIDAEKLERFFKRDEWDTPDERWRPEPEFGRFVDTLPTEDVAPVIHAKWIEDAYQDEPFVCSNCGWAENDDMHRIIGGYCVCCGAKMDEEVK